LAIQILGEQKVSIIDQKLELDLSKEFSQKIKLNTASPHANSS